MAVYAGFEYPECYVEDALLTERSNLASTVPLNEAYPPPSTPPLGNADGARVEDCVAKEQTAVFERTHKDALTMLPSFAYDIVRQRLNKVLDAAIKEAWDARRYDHLEYYSQWLLLREYHPKWLRKTRIPANTGRGWNLLNGGSYVMDVIAEIQDPSLADRGLVYLPCFVCEYTMANSNSTYNCFVSGIDSSLVAVVDPKPSWVAGSLFGLFMGGLIGSLGGCLGVPLGILGTTFGGALGALVGLRRSTDNHRQEYIAKTRRGGRKWRQRVREDRFAEEDSKYLQGIRRGEYI